MKGLFEYRKFGFNMFAFNACESGGFAKLTPAARPEISFHLVPTARRHHGRKLASGDGMTLHGCRLRPKRRGDIGLRSTDRLAAPLMKPNDLAHDEDLAELLAALKLGRRIMKFMDGAQTDPGPQTRSDTQLIEPIRNDTKTIDHPVGTCKMGHDDMEIVDDR
jgi:choline dehydrogenase-like flavoprotein